MAYVRPTSLPIEVVTLDEQKNYLRVSTTRDDALISSMISAAREQAETFTNQAIAQRNYVQALDSFPYYVDTIMSQQAYPPNYYSNPRYSTTLWNYSQMLKLFRGPLTDVVDITYVDGSGGNANDGTIQHLTEGVDFIVDPLNLQPRLFPLAGLFWPSVKFVPNAVLVNFTAGYTPNPTDVRTVTVHTNLSSPYVPDARPNQQTTYTYQIGVPYSLKLALQMMVAHWYLNREPIVAGTPGKLPSHMEDILWSFRVEDVSPTRG